MTLPSLINLTVFVSFRLVLLFKKYNDTYFISLKGYAFISNQSETALRIFLFWKGNLYLLTVKKPNFSFLRRYKHNCLYQNARFFVTLHL